jgi:hypothetical protein
MMMTSPLFPQGNQESALGMSETPSIVLFHSKRGGKSKPPRLMPLPTVNNEKPKNLLVDIDSINAARNKLAEETAAKHGVKVELVLRHLMALSSSQHERKVNLFNAKTQCLQEGSSRLVVLLSRADVLTSHSRRRINRLG